MARRLTCQKRSPATLPGARARLVNRAGWLSVVGAFAFFMLAWQAVVWSWVAALHPAAARDGR
jgi:hypothetical protein